MQTKMSFIKRLFYPFRKGERYYCTICEKGLRKFKAKGDDKICPVCGSSSQDRSLWRLMISEIDEKKEHILFISTSDIIKKKLRENPKVHFIKSIYHSNTTAFFTYVKSSLKNIKKKFNTIIFKGVSESFKDIKLFNEIFAKLKSGGRIIVQTYQRFDTKKTNQMQGETKIEDNLSKAGFRCETINLTYNKENKAGLKEFESIIIAYK